MDPVTCEVLPAVRELPDPESTGKEPATRIARIYPPQLVGGIALRVAHWQARSETEAAAELAVDAARANADFAEMFILERALDSSDGAVATAAESALSVSGSH